MQACVDSTDPLFVAELAFVLRSNPRTLDRRLAAGNVPLATLDTFVGVLMSRSSMAAILAVIIKTACGATSTAPRRALL